LLGVTEQGQPSTAAIDTERRHPVYEIDLTIPPGERRTVAFSLREPTVAGAALVPAFPAVLETTTRVDVPVCA
jgi:hypothetical protein